MTVLYILSVVSSAALADTLDAKKLDWSAASVLAEAADPVYAADGVLAGSVVGALQDSDGDTLSITWSIAVADADKASQSAQDAVKGASSYPSVDAFLHDATRAEPSEGDTLYGIVSDGQDDNIVEAFVSTRDEIVGAVAVSVTDAAAVSSRIVCIADRKNGGGFWSSDEVRVLGFVGCPICLPLSLPQINGSRSVFEPLRRSV